MQGSVWGSLVGLHWMCLETVMLFLVGAETFPAEETQDGSGEADAQEV